MDVRNELERIQEHIDLLKQEYPDFQIYITVSKEFNEKVVQFLGAEEYKIRLEELYGCRYQVSPFVVDQDWVVGLFDYSQILGQWNTFQDKMYKLNHLFAYYTNDAKKENNDWGTNAE